jgi:hypothetical protein
MKFETNNQEFLDLNFEVPTQGVSILMFEEGIQKRTNEKSGKTTLQLPFVISEVLEGSEDNEGKKLSHFVPIETKWGEKQLTSLLAMTGLLNKFAEKFKGEVDIHDDKFIDSLKLKLVGKKIKAHHDVQKDQAGKDRTVIIRFEKVQNSNPVPKTKTSEKPEEAGW